jgi:hypothetical protein
MNDYTETLVDSFLIFWGLTDGAKTSARANSRMLATLLTTFGMICKALGGCETCLPANTTALYPQLCPRTPLLAAMGELL